MTRFLLDVASYQGDLNPADVKRAGFTAVNLKISHGLSRKSVHPNLTGWIDQARDLGLGICTFHFMTADAPGADQARYAWRLLYDLGLLYGTAHQLDVEADPAPTLANVRAYLSLMTDMLQRPVALYTGDWWWAARGSWDVSDLTPYLWAAPNVGYLAGYPGDAATNWRAGYGGWSNLAVMQYAVDSLVFPGGAKGTIDVSKSAIRTEQVWTDLTQGRRGMSYAPETILAARTYIRSTLLNKYKVDMPAVSMGIVGDDSHANAGSGYHLGKDALKAGAYSVSESSRDDQPTNAAMALDFGWFSIKAADGRVHNLRTYSLWLVEQCKAGAADTKDLREVIYSPDGKTVKRWDRLGIRSSGDDSHLSHTHHSWFRDSENRDKTALFRRYFETEVETADMPLDADDKAWFNNAINAAVNGLPAKILNTQYGDAAYPARTNRSQIGDQEALRDFLGGWGNPNGDGAVTPKPGSFLDRMAYVPTTLAALTSAVAGVAQNVVADDTEKAEIVAAVQAAQQATIEGVLAGLGGSTRSDAEIAAALVAALGDRAAAVAAAMAGSAR